MPEELERDLRQILLDAEAVAADTARERLRRAQHAEIARLEQHLAAASVQWDEVRHFIDQLLAERRGSPRREPQHRGPQPREAQRRRR